MASTIISQWIDDGTGEGVYRSEVEVDYPQLSFMDLVNPRGGVPPTPNIYLGETRLLEGVEIQIENNPKYGSGTILTTPETEASLPTQEKFNAIRLKLLELGMSNADLNESIGTTANNDTLWEIKQRLLRWLRANQ